MHGSSQTSDLGKIYTQITVAICSSSDSRIKDEREKKIVHLYPSQSSWYADVAYKMICTA